MMESCLCRMAPISHIYCKELDALIMLSYNRYMRITSNGNIAFPSSQQEGQNAAANDEGK